MLLPLLFTLALPQNPDFVPLPKLKHPIAVIAHRGGRAIAPENTLAAFRKAIALGADYVEIDIRATRDGQLVIMHDRTVDRTTNGSGEVKNLDFATIRSLDAGSKFDVKYAGEKVPTLDEVLRLCRGKINVYLDHKEAPTEQVFAAVKKHKMEKQVVVYNGVEGLKEWKKLAPQLPVMPSVPNEFRREGGMADFTKILPAEVLDGNLVEWTEDLVRQAHAVGAKVYVDNLGPNDNPEGFRKAIAMGVDGIQTDHPDQLIAFLKENVKKGATTEHRGRAFFAFSDFAAFTRTHDAVPHETILTTPELASPIPANEIVVSWNVDSPAESGLVAQARAYCGGHWTKYYTLGKWSKDGKTFPRESVNGQKDADGNVATDTLILTKPVEKVEVRVALHEGADGNSPKLKFLSVALLDSKSILTPLEPNRAVWGKELAVPQRQQHGYPGGEGWCSPTSVCMALAFWSKALNRPELELTVPDVAHAIYDRVYDGTGNWPFNTAFAGSFPALRAYVTRLSDVRELEDWIAVGIPPIVSVASGLISGDPTHVGPGHLMVCVGFAPNGDIVLNDPAAHLDKGQSGRKVFKRSDFITAWKSSKFTVYLIYPEGSRLPADTYGHWE